jgi:hypothetical protein
MVESNKELEKMADSENRFLITTNCAHIFAESTNLNISGDNGGGSKVRIFSYLGRYPYAYRECSITTPLPCGLSWIGLATDIFLSTSMATISIVWRTF